ncbi:MAG: threonine--tRNA ligase [Bacilli bacterium]|nr:threonine--tRNA ligase [Bacilli bacterium]
MYKISLPDGKIIEVEDGKSYGELCSSISPSLRKKTLAVEVDGKMTDLSEVIKKDTKVRFVTLDDKEAYELLNHSCAHLLAQAVKRLYPKALFWVGPAIEEGFYYDIDLQEESINEENLQQIEKEMQLIVKNGEKIAHRILSKKEALSVFKDNPYKVELIENLPENEKISVYEQGEFIDLCRGPHVDNVKELKNFKLLKASGAYYKGDSKNKMLQRIYGVCFSSKEQLENHLNMLEEAKKRDHKKIGKEMELFMISEYGPGFPFWLPNGLVLRNQLENFWYKEHTLEGYQFIQTPIMLNQELWQISGHWQNYRENMYTSEIDNHLFAIKPMNCPGGMLVYKNSLHSYKELPLRVGELGLVHRHEASGALNGLFRVRTFTQDDAHIYMREDQIESEVVRLINFIERIYKVFGLTYEVELSTRPLDKYIGDIAVWDKAESVLASACAKAGKELKINPGDGAFYGPKLDFKIKDSLGRVWQCGTIQLDMQMPERFDLTYIDADGSKKRPIMLHRVIFGSIERFIGILTEHYAGNFPLWLAPIQVEILPVNGEAHGEYAHRLYDKFLNDEIRVSIDDRNEKLGYRLRSSQLKKVSYIVVVGENEVSNNLVTYRRHGDQEQITVNYEDFVKLLKNEIASKQ